VLFSPILLISPQKRLFYIISWQNKSGIMTSMLKQCSWILHELCCKFYGSQDSYRKLSKRARIIMLYCMYIA
jgi:hypothetical protein